MMKSSYKDRELPEAFKKNMKKKVDKEARYGSAKECPKCKGDKNKCPGGKSCPMTAKKDMGRKSPYADGMCSKRGDIAAEFDAVMINDAEREDKPCGNSYIPQNAKCNKGAGQAKKPAEKSGKAQYEALSDRQKAKLIRQQAKPIMRNQSRETIKSALKANKGKTGLENRTIEKAAKRELFNRNVRNVAAAGLYGVAAGSLLSSALKKRRG